MHNIDVSKGGLCLNKNNDINYKFYLKYILKRNRIKKILNEKYEKTLKSQKNIFNN